MNDIAEFEKTRAENISEQGQDAHLKQQAKKFLVNVSRYKYSYNFNWLGLPIIQFPQDIVAMQEVIWQVKPTVIVETGVARGGSLIFSASMLQLIHGPGKGRVVGIDIDIRKHNREAILAHPLAPSIQMIEGSSVDPTIFSKVEDLITPEDKVLVILDSNHTHQHVLEELKLYERLVKAGSYLLVMDTVVEEMPLDAYPDRPWGKGNNPMTAVRSFLKENDRFEVDTSVEDKLLITVAPSGYLKCIR